MGIIGLAAILAALLGSHSWSLPILSNFERAVFDVYRYYSADVLDDEQRITVMLYDEAVNRERCAV